MNRSPALLICGALLLGGCSKKETVTVKNTNETAANGNPITAPVDYLGAVAKAKHHSEKVIDTVSVNGAIQKFYAMEDRFPRDLDELVSQHYVASVPAPPPGTKWQYNPQTGDLKAVRQP